ncbi:MAG TPA: hypothetical protein VK988_10325, partial [Acidimicrobiales bacterium]|nr:hypothetical protein [Acidimicrobiales bacterium]
MEGVRSDERNQFEGAAADGWAAWAAAPRDGPGLFVIDTRAFDNAGEIRGRWLDPDVEPEVLYDQVRQLLGR